MEMRKKTVAMTLVDGKLVDNYELPNLRLTEDAAVVYRLIHKKVPFVCPIRGITHWLVSGNLETTKGKVLPYPCGEVDDTMYFKNKMLQEWKVSKVIDKTHEKFLPP